MSGRRFPPNWRDVGNLPSRISLPTLQINPNDPNGHSDPPPNYILNEAPSGKKWRKNYDFSSEFNRESNTEIVPMRQLQRWTTRNHWQGRFPAVFDMNNVLYNGRSMVLQVREHDAPTDGFLRVFERGNRAAINSRMSNEQKFYTGSFVRSVDTITYGYFETVVKLGDSTLSSAFWLKEIGGREREIDAFEYSTGLIRNRGTPLSHQYLMNVHSFEKNGNRRTDHENSKWVISDRDLSREKFIKVGLLWTKEKVCWYLNDELVRNLNHGGEFRNAQMRVQFDREYFRWIEDPSADDNYGDFEVMYIRTWQLDKSPMERIGESMRRMGSRMMNRGRF